MKSPLFRLVLLLAAPFFAAMPFGCSSQAPQQEPQPTIKIDFENSTQILGCYFNQASISKSNALSEGASLLIDTSASSSEWNGCFKTPPGLLKGGGDYVVEFTCKNLSLGTDSWMLFLIRPFDASNGQSDVGDLAFSPVGVERNLKMAFSIPKGAESYSFQIHTRKQAVALVDNIRIRPGTPESFMPAAAAVKPSQPLKVPTGCAEFQVELPNPKSQLSVSAADFGADPASPDNAKAFNDAIAHCKASGASKLVVPKGVYRFTSSKAPTFEDLSDFEFDGQGSTFVFLKNGGGGLVRVSRCLRTALKNFNVDWDWDKDPLASVVKVEAVEAKEGAYADFKFVDYESFPRRDLRVADIEQLDPETMSVGCEGAVNASFEFFRGKSEAPKTEWLSGNTLRIFSTKQNKGLFLDRLKAGTLFRMRHYVYDMPGIDMRDNVHLTLSGVNVYSAPSHAFVTSGMQHHWQFLNTNIVRPPGTKRPITCTADHHHISQSLGYFKMDGCEFSLGGDDCLNVHDCTGFGAKTGPKTLTTRNLREYVVSSMHPGDLVELRHDDYSPTGVSSKIVEIKKVSVKDGIYEISFADPMPEPKGDGFILFNRRYDSGNVIVRNCYFHNHRARGLLLLAHDVTVENCVFLHNQMGAIKIETGYTFNVWSEGYGASNIVIRNNSFENVNPLGAYRNEKRPVIYMSVYLKSDPSKEKTMYPVIQDVLIEGNSFLNCPGAIAYACSAKNVIIRGNTVVNDVPRKEEMPYRGAVGAAYSSDVFITGNKWTKSPLMPNIGLFYDGETCKDIYCWDNKVVDR